MAVAAHCLKIRFETQGANMADKSLFALDAEGLGMSAFGGRADIDFGWLEVCL